MIRASKKPFDFNSKSFQRDLKKIHKKIEEMENNRKIDTSKLHMSFDV